MNLLKSSLLGAAAVLAISHAAQAADPIIPAPVLPAVPAPVADNWTGFYAGVNAGYGFGQAYDNTGAVVTGTWNGVPFTADSVNGLLGGAQIGGNVQQDALVFGIEADIQASGISQSVQGGGSTLRIGLDYFGTVRGRVGVDLDGVLPYLTAGFAYGRGTVDAGAFGSDSHFHTGWTAGGGVEFKLDDSISLKGEYLYTDLGSAMYHPAIGGLDTGLRFHTIRAGVNFLF